jgi:hypothetical protein
MVECPECGREVSDRALMCPSCGLAFVGRQVGEYRSKTTIAGLPLVHFVIGPPVHPLTGRLRIAKGIIAIGPIAVGGLAVGGTAFGIIAIGGLAFGLAALAGVAVGLGVALGGVAIGGIAIGGCAIGYYALGGAVFGVHPMGANAWDEQGIRFFDGILGGGREPGPPPGG